MKRSCILTSFLLLALCALRPGGALPAMAQESGPATPQQADAAGSPESVEAIQAALGSSITYQGSLKKNGQPVTAACHFEFLLYDAPTGGTMRGPSMTIPSWPVQAGVFTVKLNFGAEFRGEALWLQTAVRCPGDSALITLSPRQEITSAAYAFSLAPGAVVRSAQTGDIFYVEQNASNANAIHGKANATGSIGVWGEGVNNTGVYGLSRGGAGVWGRSSTGKAVYGVSQAGTGVSGETAGLSGVSGTSSNIQGVGVMGTGYVGVEGHANGTLYSQGVRGDNGGSNTVGYAGAFNGRVAVAGNLSKGGGSFKIDHPLDPERKYLSHSFVESPDMKNIYDGVVTLDARGEATVQLPDWFAALNGGAEHRSDYRYQLTSIGGYAPVYISREIADNRFGIAGGTPGLKVSWQVTGIRHDPYAEQNRIMVEEDKPAAEQGKYLYPVAYDRPASEGIAALNAPQVDAAAMAEGARP